MTSGHHVRIMPARRGVHRLDVCRYCVKLVVSRSARSMSATARAPLRRRCHGGRRRAGVEVSDDAIRTSQNPSIPSATHSCTPACQLHPSLMLEVSTGIHRPSRPREEPAVFARLLGEGSEAGVAVSPVRSVRVNPSFSNTRQEASCHLRTVAQT